VEVAAEVVLTTVLVVVLVDWSSIHLTPLVLEHHMPLLLVKVVKAEKVIEIAPITQV
tara:strand:- start:656 stop:826 length:171 start_codon:yes stop_codon:yes gene_type:complete